MRDKPHIILCTCDQLRAFEVGCYGNAVIRTPNIDRLAAEGVRFEHAVTNYPVCMAARSVLLSGQHNRTCTGGIGNVAYPGAPGDFVMPEYPQAGRPHLKDVTLPEALRQAGYYNVAIGKWHIHSWPHDIGFHEYVIPRVHHCHTGQSFTENGGPEFVPSGYSVDYEIGRVEAFLQERAQQEQPFFLYYNISPPHCPVADAPEKYRLMYRPEEIPLRPNVMLDRPLERQDYWFKVYRWDFRHYHLHLPYTDELPEGYTLRHLIAEYYGMTTWVDDTIGRMMAALERTGLAEDTIVVFVADHGDNLGSHGLVQKGGPNEEAIRIPMIVRWPRGIPAGQVVAQQVASLVDVMPSLLHLIGAPIPATVQGQSLTPILREERRALECTEAIIETSAGAGIRTPRYLYFASWEEKRALAAKPSQFYDLMSDPYQFDNLAGRATQRDVQEALGARLQAWHERTPWLE